jgi:hypothetical protein
LNVSAIPRRFLPHTATLFTESAPDVWGHCEQTETELTNVRIDRKESVGVTGGRRVNKSGAVMFYDSRNSTPTGVNFSLSGGGIRRQSIGFEGRRYAIEKVEYLYAADTLHHLEITLGELMEEDPV